MSDNTYQRLKAIARLVAASLVSLGSLYLGIYLDPTLMQFVILGLMTAISIVVVWFKDNNVTKARIFAQNTLDIMVADFDNNRKDPDEFWGSVFADKAERGDVEDGLSQD